MGAVGIETVSDGLARGDIRGQVQLEHVAGVAPREPGQAQARGRAEPREQDAPPGPCGHGSDAASPWGSVKAKSGRYTKSEWPITVTGGSLFRRSMSARVGSST